MASEKKPEPHAYAPVPSAAARAAARAEREARAPGCVSGRLPLSCLSLGAAPRPSVSLASADAPPPAGEARGVTHARTWRPETTLGFVSDPDDVGDARRNVNVCDGGSSLLASLAVRSRKDGHGWELVVACAICVEYHPNLCLSIGRAGHVESSSGSNGSMDVSASASSACCCCCCCCCSTPSAPETRPPGATVAEV